jgi:hypothetical protein
MNISQAKTLVKTTFNQQLKTGVRMSIELQSGPGVGKSEAVAQIASELGNPNHNGPGKPHRDFIGSEVGFKPFFLSTVEAPDVRGFAVPAKDAAGVPIMQFTRAPWVPTGQDPTHGILFLDEFRQAGHDVQKPAAELLLNGRVGESELPITWMVVAASNRESDRSGVQRELAFVSNRRMLIQIQPELDAWVAWAEKKAIHWTTVAFAKVNPGVVFTNEVPQKGGPFCTPRSLVKLSYLIDTMPIELFTEAAAGMIGEGVAAQFVSFLRVAQQIPTFEEITKDPKKCRLPESDRPDAQYATMQMVSYRVDKDTAKPAFEYLKRMPKEFQVAGLKSALTRSGSLVQSKGFAEWLKENKELVMNANLLDRNN